MTPQEMANYEYEDVGRSNYYLIPIQPISTLDLEYQYSRE
jgi:hypothetical protein